MNTTTLEDEIDAKRLEYEAACLDNSPNVDRLREELRMLQARAGDAFAASRAKLRRELDRTAQQQQRRRRAASDEARKAITKALALVPPLAAKLDDLMGTVKELRALDAQARAAISRANGSHVTFELLHHTLLTTMDLEQAVIGDGLGQIHPLGPRVESQLTTLAQLIPSDEE